MSAVPEGTSATITNLWLVMVHHTLTLKHPSQVGAVECALYDVMSGSGVSFKVQENLPHYVTFVFGAPNESPEELIAKAWGLVRQAGLEHEFEERQ